MKKPDLSGIKTFLFAKGEKVGAIVCTAIMALVVGWSLYNGLSSRGAASGKSWAEEIKGEATSLDQRITSARAPEGEGAKPPAIPDWVPRIVPGPWGRWFVLPDPGFTKKMNPRALAILGNDEDKYIQIDYVRGSYLHYEINQATKKVLVIVGAGGAAGGGAVGAALPANMVPKGMPGGAAAGGNANPALDARPLRMVVVSAVFPMREQLDEYRKSLRYSSIAELLASRDNLPKPIGIDVSRAEILPGGKATGWNHIMFRYDAKTGKTEITPSIKAMLRHMVIDEENPSALAKFVFPGLVTPLPKLGHSKYPKLEIKGLEVKEVVAENEPKEPKIAGKQPKFQGFNLTKKPRPAAMPPEQGVEAAGPVGADVQLRLEPWKSVPKDLQDRFAENYFAFDPLATPMGAEAKKGGANLPPGGAAMMQPLPGAGAGAAVSFANPWDRILGGAGAGGNAMLMPPGMPPGVPMPEGQEPMPEQPGGQPQTVELTDALVRFFDPDVQPGKTYVYTVRVHLANPNFGKKNDVAFDALADQKELDWYPGTGKGWPANGWMVTPEVTIPGDYHWYATDTTPDPKIRGGAEYLVPPGRSDLTPIQVHRWVDRATHDGSDYTIGSWIIAERFWARRGDPIGRQGVWVEAPVWYRNKQAFEIGQNVQAARKKQPVGAVLTTGLPVDLMNTPPALIVDFDGGKRDSVRIGREFVNDTSAVDVLVLTPEGRLVVRDSRHDTDPELPAGQERHERFETWRDYLKELRQGGRAAAPAAGPPGMPPMGERGGR